VYLNPGDVVVQQATNHGWINPGTQPCRILFVPMDSKQPNDRHVAATRAGPAFGVGHRDNGTADPSNRSAASVTPTLDDEDGLAAGRRLSSVKWRAEIGIISI
jgi:hypothetical protein